MAPAAHIVINIGEEMSKRSHGLFSGRTRHLSRHNKVSRTGLTRLINKFEAGDKVVISPMGNFRNIPHPRYRGRIATVLESRGKAYVVQINISKSMKRSLVVPQEHLKRIPKA